MRDNKTISDLLITHQDLIPPEVNPVLFKGMDQTEFTIPTLDFVFKLCFSLGWPTTAQIEQAGAIALALANDRTAERVNAWRPPVQSTPDSDPQLRVAEFLLPETRTVSGCFVHDGI